MDDTWKPWPLSELDDDERARILSLPRKEREAAIERLKGDIKSGRHAQRHRWRLAEGL